MDKKTVGLRKRQQISQANQLMFLSIAGVSVVVGFCIVLIIFLGQKILFEEKVIAEKAKTQDVLQKNIDVVDTLKDNIRVLNTNEDLKSTRLNDTDQAIQSVLDALPADANSTAMAASLQTKLLAGVSGVSIESLKVEPVEDEGSSSNTILFSFAVSAESTNQAGLREILLRVEKSIRPFNIINLAIESQGKKVLMTASGEGYYEPAQSVGLTEKVVRP